MKALYTTLALLNVFVAPLNAFRHPGGAGLIIVPMITGMVTLPLCFIWYSHAPALERVMRLICAGAAVLAICMPVIGIALDRLQHVSR